MSYRTAFRSAILTLVLLGYFALAFSEEIAPPFLLLFPAGLLTGLALERRPSLQQRLIPLNSYGFYPLAAFAVVDYTFLSRNFALVFVNFTFLLTIVKWVTPKANRDWIQIVGLSFLQLLGASILSFDLYIGAILLAYLVVGAWSLMLLHLKAQWDRLHPPSLPGRESWPSDRLSWGLLGALGSLSVVVLLVAVGTFLVLPRAQFGLMDNLLSANYGTQANLAGFSDVTRLRGRGAITDNVEVILRVYATDPTPANLQLLRRMHYWKGVTLVDFDGVQWTARESPPRGDRRQVEYETPSNREFWTPIAATVRMGPNNTRYLFHHPRLAQLETRYLGMVRSPEESIYRKPSGTTAGAPFDNNAMEYRILSWLPRDPSEPLRESVRAPARETRRFFEDYLRLPDGLDPRIAQEAVRLTEGGEDDWTKARTLETHLSTQYRYDDNLPEVDLANPLGDFLFKHRRGHCEYYASALAVMLRSLKIPARVVNGYLGGEFNDLGHYLVVRQLHAHSWVEAMLPDGDEYFWVTLDGTPPDYRESRRQPQVGRFVRWIEALQSQWMAGVIDFSVKDQEKAFWAAYAGLSRRHGTPWLLNRQNAQASDRPMVAALVGTAVLIGLALGAWALWGWGNRALADRRRLQGPFGYYHRMLGLLRKAGFEKTPQQTPSEFSRTLSVLPPEAWRTVRDITRRFERERYGSTVESSGPDSMVGLALLRRLGTGERGDRRRH